MFEVLQPIEKVLTDSMVICKFVITNNYSIINNLNKQKR